MKDSPFPSEGSGTSDVLGFSETRLKDGQVARLRLATPDDAAAVTAFVNVVGGERRFVLRERATWSLEEEQKTLGTADGRESAFFLGEVGGRLVGLLNIGRGRWPKNRHVAEFGMSCHPDFRRLGVGTALLNRALTWAQSVGVQKVTLEVFSSNAPAIALYLRMGFVEEGRRFREFLIEDELVDGILMARWL